MPRKKAPEHGPVRTELETTLASDVKLKAPRYAALVALCRVTADQVDQAGAEVSSRLIASYLSALKDLDKALGTGRATPTPAGGEKGATGGSTLGGLRSIAGGKS